WDYFNYEISQKGLTLLSNAKGQLPFDQLLEKEFRIIDYEEPSFRYFKNTFNQYADHQARQGAQIESEALKTIIDGNTNYTNILLLENLYPDPVRDSAFYAGLAAANRKGKLVIINFGDLKQLSSLDSSYTILQCYERSRNTEELAAQILFGAQKVSGLTPQTILPNWPDKTGKAIASIRLAHGKAKDAGIRPEKLVGINAIAKAAIKKKAAPGCQVVVAKDGKIIYSEAFGHHTYRKRRSVQTDDLYDIASITKIAATSLVAMQQYEQGTYKINDRVKNVLPEFKKAPFKNTRIKDLLTHRSGIQPHLPVVPYLLYRGPENTACDSFFCSQASDNYPIQVADKFYFKSNYIDTIWENMNSVRMQKVRRHKYSDMNLVLMQRLLEKKGNMKLNQMTYRSFYKPLGLRHTSFNPNKYYAKDELIPTEKDEKWRQQQVHGFVHDEAAALLGGVAGHAGLFANAEDLAVIMQMLLNGGNYAGQQFLKPETINLFTDDGYGNHRGLIFDKRHSSNRSGRAYDLSSAAFGHTGFTGTCAWVDPEHNLVYVFLSNRVFPEKNNRKLFSQRVRTRIHQVVYDALGSYEHAWPELEM
ncbi:MAG: serine hydrolase, partial [Bacteroidota bacterium]